MNIKHISNWIYFLCGCYLWRQLQNHSPILERRHVALNWTILLEVLALSDKSADTRSFNGKVAENYYFLRRRFIDLRCIFQKQLVLHEPTINR